MKRPINIVLFLDAIPFESGLRGAVVASLVEPLRLCHQHALLGDALELLCTDGEFSRRPPGALRRERALLLRKLLARAREQTPFECGRGKDWPRHAPDFTVGSDPNSKASLGTLYG